MSQFQIYALWKIDDPPRGDSGTSASSFGLNIFSCLNNASGVTIDCCSHSCAIKHSFLFHLDHLAIVTTLDYLSTSNTVSGVSTV